jgi:hypothetical protein
LIALATARDYTPLRLRLKRSQSFAFFSPTVRRGAYAGSADIDSRSERHEEVPRTLWQVADLGYAIAMTISGGNASRLSKSSSKNPTGLRLQSRRLSDCEWNSGKPNCSAVSNSLAANGIPQNGSGKFTSAPCRRRLGVQRMLPKVLESFVRAVLSHASNGSQTPKGRW